MFCLMFWILIHAMKQMGWSALFAFLFVGVLFSFTGSLLVSCSIDATTGEKLAVRYAEIVQIVSNMKNVSVCFVHLFLSNLSI